MNPADQHRIAKRHLDIDAIVYVRQSDQRQVRENMESTRLQRGLREGPLKWVGRRRRWLKMIWALLLAALLSDQGFNGCLRRLRCAKLESYFVSRLSRNSSDWVHLFEMCGYFDTLVADVQQIYDVSIPNDRLVLQIKGTVAELELSSLKTRLRAGIEAKAARGELKMLLPPGYIYDMDDRIVMDPNKRVQQAVRTMFHRFEHTTSVRQLAINYREQKELFPVRKPRKKEGLVWALPQRYMLHKLLSHPVYAGVYARGRSQTYIDYSEGKLVKRTKRVASPEGWSVCIKDHHEAYISWKQFQSNQARLAEARPRWTMDDNQTAVRAGRALLAGLMRCGQCGRKLRVTYNRKSSATYNCDGAGPRGADRCISFGAKYVDKEVGEQLCQAMEPIAIDAAERAFKLEQQEREQSVEQARLSVQAAQYAADRAFEQYDLAAPKNRLVIDTLEIRLNKKLAEVRVAQAELEKRQKGAPPLSSEQRSQIRKLSKDFSQVWNHPKTPTQLRKQLLRIAIREVVVKRDGAQLAFMVHWTGDTCTQLSVNKRATPVGSKTDPSLTELVRRLAETLDDAEIARILNIKKLRTPRDLRWRKDRVHSFRMHHRMKQSKKTTSDNVLTGQQARDYLGMGYHGLMALVNRGAIHTNQVTDFAPWRILRSELDSKAVQDLVTALKSKGRLPPDGGSPSNQPELFAMKSTLLRKDAL